MPISGKTVLRERRAERAAAVFAVATLIAAWVAGAMLARQDDTPFLHAALPPADRFEPRRSGTFAAYRAEEILGYVAIGEATGYGGPIRVAVAVDRAGVVIGTAVIGHTETPSFFARATSRGYLQQLLGKRYSDDFDVGTDLDGITGATVTARALAEAVRMGSRLVAGSELGRPVPSPAPPALRFGGPEITVLLLYAGGFFAHRRRLKHRAVLRWTLLLTGLLALGFWYNMPLTLSKVSALLLGYWPAWQTNLYWYFLIGGVLLVATVDGKNAYCSWFCPFGAAQECMGAIGGARHVVARRHWYGLVWVQRTLAWAALSVALLFRNPGMSSYEVFGTLFSFTGSAGAFDVTIQPLLEVYDRHRTGGALPPEDVIRRALRLVDFHLVQASEAQVRLAQSGMAVTLDGIAKGYAVDQCAAVLRSRGYDHVLVEAGGDLLTRSGAAEDRPWRIGVQAPRGAPGQVLARLELRDQAVATSGDYLQPYSADLRSHHIVDPRTGYSSPELASATVTAPGAAAADALSTAVMVLGVDQGLALVEAWPNADALLVGKDLHVSKTTGFPG